MSLTYGVPGWRCVRNRISFTRSRWKNTEFAIAAASAWKIYKTFSRNNAFLRTPRKAGVAVSENKGEGVMFYRITWTRKKERKWQRCGRENCHDTQRQYHARTPTKTTGQAARAPNGMRRGPFSPRSSAWCTRGCPKGHLFEFSSGDAQASRPAALRLGSGACSEYR